MPKSLSTLMAAIAALGIAPGAFLQTGRWYGALSEPEQSSVDFLRTATLGYVGMLAAIMAPIVLCDLIRDRRSRRREALEARMAEAERIGQDAAPPETSAMNESGGRNYG